MSSKIPTISQDFLRERGVTVSIVICPRCEDKWEQAQGKDAVCAHCGLQGVAYTTFSKMRAIAEIDLLPFSLFQAFLLQVIIDCYNKRMPDTAKFLDNRLQGIQTVMGISLGENIVPLNKILEVKN